MRSIDINADLGEDTGNDKALLPWISSANISCGYHAGSEEGIQATIQSCWEQGIAIGAHPSWPDRENFGRVELHLPPSEVYGLIQEQLQYFSGLCKGAPLHHVKPHGALYNQSARDATLAAAVAQAVKDFNASLILYGLSGSVALSVAQSIGLRTAAEVFADRTYLNDGSLCPRSQPGAVITDTAAAVKQAWQMVTEGTVTTMSGKVIPLQADTLCLHGDGAYAVTFARAIYEQLKAHQIEIVPLS